MDTQEDRERDYNRCRIRRFLAKRVIDGCGPITYLDLLKELRLAHPDMQTDSGFHEDLDIVSAMEFIEGRPLLSVLVVRKIEGDPGDGFFELVRKYEIAS